MWRPYNLNHFTLLIALATICLFRATPCWGASAKLIRCTSLFSIPTEHKPKIRSPEDVISEGAVLLFSLALKFTLEGKYIRLTDINGSQAAEFESTQTASTKYSLDFEVNRVPLRGKGLLRILFAKFLSLHPNVRTIEAEMSGDNRMAFESALESASPDQRGTKSARVYALSQMPIYKVAATFGFILDPTETTFYDPNTTINASSESILGLNEQENLSVSIHIVMNKAALDAAQ